MILLTGRFVHVIPKITTPAGQLPLVDLITLHLYIMPLHVDIIYINTAVYAEYYIVLRGARCTRRACIYSAYNIILYKRNAVVSFARFKKTDCFECRPP